MSVVTVTRPSAGKIEGRHLAGQTLEKKQVGHVYLKPHPSEGPEMRIVKLVVSWCVQKPSFIRAWGSTASREELDQGNDVEKKLNTETVFGIFFFFSTLIHQLGPVGLKLALRSPGRFDKTDFLALP